MSSAPTAAVPRSQRPLTRERILRAALELIERHGIAHLSMRSIAAELGCEAMSLYNHVPNKAAIIDGVVETTLADFTSPDVDHLDWRDALKAQMRAFREFSLSQPQGFPLVGTRHIASPVGFRPVEATLVTLERGGFDREGAVHAFWALMNFASGAIRSQAMNRAGFAAARVEYVESGIEALDPCEFPHAADLVRVMRGARHAEEFEFGLDAMIEGLCRRIA